MKAINIVWETDGQKVDLPNEVEVPNDVEMDEVANWISDRYGWLIISLNIID